MSTVLAAIAAALLSGFGGAYLGAWITTRHDRIERLRALRTSAADDAVQAWSAALFAIDAASMLHEDRSLTNVDMKRDAVRGKIAEAHQLVNHAVTLSVRIYLLFTSISVTARNADAVLDEARQALIQLKKGNAQEARRLHDEASVSQYYLVLAAGEAIASTGTKRDVARDFKIALKVDDIHPHIRVRKRERELSQDDDT
jgi:hypothetical protein